MQLSGKPTTFGCVFIAFLKFTLNLQHFQKKKKKKNELHSLNISEIIDSERRGYLNE